MKPFNTVRGSCSLWILTLAVLSLSQGAKAASQTWQATVGAQSLNGSTQVIGFLPNELWIRAGDSITWTTKSGENHTVTFLKTGQNRPSTAQGCQFIPPSTTPTGESAVTLSGSSYDPAATADVDSGGADSDTEPCVNSGPICDRTLQVMPDPTACPNMPTLTYTVKFPTAGNFKFVCLIHRDMTGVIHVLSTSAVLPHDPDFYEDEAIRQARDILSDTDHAKDRRDDDDRPGDSSGHIVITTGELVATGGGKLPRAVFRFLPETIHVHVGDTVEWTNVDPSIPHTITFGNPAPPAGTGVSDPDLDNDLHGTLPNATGFNSGNIGPALQDQTNQPQPAPGQTRVKITFTQPGEFDYYCTLHVALGMTGKVIVGPSR